MKSKSMRYVVSKWMFMDKTRLQKASNKQFSFEGLCKKCHINNHQPVYLHVCYVAQDHPWSSHGAAAAADGDGDDDGVNPSVCVPAGVAVRTPKACGLLHLASLRPYQPPGENQHHAVRARLHGLAGHSAPTVAVWRRLLSTVNCDCWPQCVLTGRPSCHDHSQLMKMQQQSAIYHKHTTPAAQMHPSSRANN